MAFNASPELLAVSRYARERVRVLLTGESADELFGGYGRFRQYRHLRLMSVAGYALRPVKGRLRSGSRLDRAAKTSRLSRPEWIASTYGDLERFGRAPLSEWAPYRFEIASRAVRDHSDPVLQALAYERQTHLPAVLDNTDRLTMGAAIEARLPFTAPALLEFAGLARRADLFEGANGKKPVRDAMAGRLPQKILSRPKRGWTSPYRDYLRQLPELRSWLVLVPQHPIVAGSRHGPTNAQAIIDGFLAGNDALASDAWTIGRIVLWHQVCIEGVRHPFGRGAPRPASA